jgi:hypothetical protein
MTSATGPLRGLEFCLWCRDRAIAEFGETVWDGLSPADRSKVDSVLQELDESLAQGKLINPGRAEALQEEIVALGPEGDAVQDVHSDAVEMRSLIWHTLEFCRAQSPSSLCAVSEAMVNSWDLRLGDHEGYSNENMFSFPSLKQELARQEHYLGSQN